MGRYRQLYDSLLESGELKMMFSGMKGNWEIDKDKFVREQEKMENILDINVHTDDEND